MSGRRHSILAVKGNQRFRDIKSTRLQNNALKVRFLIIRLSKEVTLINQWPLKIKFRYPHLIIGRWLLATLLRLHLEQKLTNKSALTKLTLIKHISTKLYTINVSGTGTMNRNTAKCKKLQNLVLVKWVQEFSNVSETTCKKKWVRGYL